MNTTKKIALITGATRGIGYALSLALAKADYHVLALGRKAEDLEKLDDAVADAGGTCTLIPQDLRKVDELVSLGPQLFERFGKLNAAFLNAAILGPLTPIAQITQREWRKVMDVNLDAQFALIGTLDPLLRGTPNSHLVGLSTGRVHEPKAFWGPYAASKAGFEALLKAYALEVAPSGLKVHIYDPGRVQTDMRATAYPGEDVSLLRAPSDVANELVALL